MVQIKITNAAKKDIKNIFKFIKKESYQNAEMVAEAIIRKIDTLYTKPDFGKIVKEN
jgi:plasmid stabilization system protein ParE